MGDGVGVQISKSEIWRVVDQAAVFGAQRHMFHDGEVRPASVYKKSLRLSLRSSDAGKSVPRGIKYQGSPLLLVRKG